MKVRWLAGKRAGEVEHVRNNDPAIHTMLRAGMCEEILEPGAHATPAPALAGMPDRNHTSVPFYPTPVWANAIVATTRRPTIVKTVGCSETNTYANWENQNPKAVTDAALKAGCPKEIVERYLAEMKVWRSPFPK